jgi:NitT/TauT family transport system substrate-binding protein
MKQTLLAAALFAVSLAGAAVAEPVPMRVGWAQVPTQMTPLIAKLATVHPELFRNINVTYSYEPMRFQGSPPQIQAFAAGGLDVAAFGPAALALAVNNAHLELRIVADIAQDGGTTGHYSSWWAVRKDGPIKTIEDMKGHIAIVNAKGATTDMMLRQTMRRHGVADTDFVEIEADFANMLAMLESGKADTAPVMVQFNHDFVATGRYRSLFTTSEALGGEPSQTLFWVMKADFIAAHRAAIVDFLAGHMAGLRWFLDPRNRDEALSMTAAFTKQSPEALDYAFTKGDVYRSPDLLPVIAPIQKDIDLAVSMNMLPARIEVAPRYVDLTLIADAKAQLAR